MKSCVLLCVSTAGAAIVHVPADQITIRDGIGAAANGDTVIVAPGTYPENNRFLGKAILLMSSGGRDSTAMITTEPNGAVCGLCRTLFGVVAGTR
jgi:hypothetical protein